MFGNNNTNGAAPRGAGDNNRPPASEVAKIDGMLTHILVGDETTADGIAVFVGGRSVPIGEVESIGVEIVAPTDTAPQGTLTAILSRYSTDANGQQRTQTASALFPGTVEVIARGRRITLSCQQAGSFDGLWLGLGLRPDGTSTELSGVQSLRVLIDPGSKLLDARLTWVDTGETQDLLG